MNLQEIERVISVGLDPNGDTAKIIIAKLQAADELIEYMDENPHATHGIYMKAQAYRNASKG